jgi:hypothetical protein
MVYEKRENGRIGIIHLTEFDPGKDQEKISATRERIKGYGKEYPGASFSFIETYRFLLESIRNGDPLFDVIIAARMMDRNLPSINNICVAAYDSRSRFDSRDEYLEKGTVFVISSNDVMQGMKGIDVNAQREYLDMLKNQEKEHYDPDIGGMILTASTERTFLVEVAFDVLCNRRPYMEYRNPGDRSRIKTVESQEDFINYPPGQTRMGYRLD